MIESKVEFLNIPGLYVSIRPKTLCRRYGLAKAQIFAGEWLFRSHEKAFDIKITWEDDNDF
jgi:hypothetical protein